MGALDCAWIITKEDRYSDEGTLNVTGRDMESQKLKIRFNKCTFQWEYVGTEEDVNKQRRIAWFAQNPIRETDVYKRQVQTVQKNEEKAKKESPQD